MCPVPKAIYRACWLTMCISCFYLVSVPLFLLAGTYNLHGKVNGMCVNNLDTFLHWYGSYKHILSDKTFDSFIIIVSPSQRETPLYKHIISNLPEWANLLSYVYRSFECFRDTVPIRCYIFSFSTLRDGRFKLSATILP